MDPSAQRNDQEPDLFAIARKDMAARGMWPEFSPDVLQELETLTAAAEYKPESQPDIKDQRNLLWFSVDNDDSKDLDQLTYAERIEDSKYKIFIAIADVTCLIAKGSKIDLHAQHNTTSVYTPMHNFLMLPEKLSTGLTSLNPDVDRLAMVVEIVVNEDGTLGNSALYRACVHNKAKLVYNRVAAWIEGKEPLPESVQQLNGLWENIKLQDEIAQKMKRARELAGSLVFETVKLRAVIKDGHVAGITTEEKNNRAQQIIENFMIAANSSTTTFLERHGFPTLRRIVKTPDRWLRIVQLAEDEGFNLPLQPDVKALRQFLVEKKQQEPDKFADLSLAVIKLMGRGEYILKKEEDTPTGHFALAVRDYTHSTAPNRRYTDVIVQRLVKAALKNEPCPYTPEELADIAKNCTQREADADKVERRVLKSAVAVFLAPRVGEVFEAMVVGASQKEQQKGIWVRLLPPEAPIEGRLVKGGTKSRKADIGMKYKVKLVKCDAKEGHIDFEKVKEESKDKNNKQQKNNNHNTNHHNGHNNNHNNNHGHNTHRNHNNGTDTPQEHNHHQSHSKHH